MKRFALVISVLVFSCVASAQTLTLLHMNDTHSHIDPERGGDHKGMGGVIEQAAYVDSVRLADGKRNVLLLHAGDFSQGTSYFTELNGDMEIDVLEAMGFDAVCLGNHEFDNGMDELARRLGNLSLPVLCANYDFSGTSLEKLVRPYVILKKAGYRIGIIGLMPDVTHVVSREIAVRMKFLNPVEVTDRYAAMLKHERKCDLVICLSHLGFDCKDYSDLSLAASVRNIDVIVGGHTHTFLERPSVVRNPDGNDVIVVTAGSWGHHIGNLKIYGDN